jgi:RNA polymerase sigma-70 factor (ECF subfamily)
LLSFAISLTKNDFEAEDLYQDTVFLALKNKEKFNAGTNFTAWTKTIMRNTFINNYRQKKRFKELFNKNISSYFFNKKEGENGSEMDMNVKEINQLIDQIDDRFSIPFRLYFQGFSYEEIAGQLDLPMGTVKSRIFFARKHLKQAYELHFDISKNSENR